MIQTTRLYDSVLLAVYFFIAVACFVTLQVYHRTYSRRYIVKYRHIHTFVTYLYSALLVLLQFAIGAIIAEIVVFYSQGSTLTGGWLYLVILAAVLISYQQFVSPPVRFAIQVGVFFAALYSLAVFSVPVLAGTVGWSVFVVSGVVTVAISFFFLYLYNIVGATAYTPFQQYSFLAIAIIFVGMNVLYVTETMPPLPLSVDRARVFHSITYDESTNTYLAERESLRWHDFLRAYYIVRVPSGEGLAVFSSVFAPVGNPEQIIHVWQSFDSQNDEWSEEGRIEFPVRHVGEGSYRGYSRKETVSPGLWRVDIRSTDGRTIGRVNFRIVETQEWPNLEIERL